MEMYDTQNEYAYDGEGCYDYESSDYESECGYESHGYDDDAWGNRDDEYDGETMTNMMPPVTVTLMPMVIVKQ